MRDRSRGGKEEGTALNAEDLSAHIFLAFLLFSGGRTTPMPVLIKG